jgi:hypothetical protein
MTTEIFVKRMTEAEWAAELERRKQVSLLEERKSLEKLARLTALVCPSEKYPRVWLKKKGWISGHDSYGNYIFSRKAEKLLTQQSQEVAITKLERGMK